MSTPESTIVPPGWDKIACIHWQKGQRAEAVQATLAAVNQAPHQDLRLTLQLAYYLFFLNDYRAAAAMLENQLTVTPDHFETLLNLSVCYARLDRCAEGVVLAQRVLAIQPDNFAVLDGLTSCLYRLQRHDEAVESGTRSLVLKDRRCDATHAQGWALPAGRPQDFAGQPGKRHVISYSLWGAQPTYLRGGLSNLLLASDIYPRLDPALQCG